MPKEKLYISGQVENDGQAPDLTIEWWQELSPAIMINGHKVDRSTINRLIRVLRRARDQYYGADE